MTALTDAQVRHGFLAHATLAQLFRWWQFYERPESTLANQLDILSEDVHIDSSGSAVDGRSAYQAYAESLPQMQNSHWFDAPSLSIDVSGSEIAASLDAKYLNIGAMPDGQLMNAAVHYDVELARSADELLPTFTNIKITAGAGDGATEFLDAYPNNRVASLVHYYLALIGDPAGEIESFSEVFTDQIALKFSTGEISSLDEFGEWVRTYNSSTDAATLTIESMDVVVNDDGTFTATIDFEWDGLMDDGSRMEMGTRHVWNVVDEPADPFARIQSISVEQTREMAPRS